MKRKFQIPSAGVQASILFRPDHPWLAPLAGYSDLPFRLLCREYGAAVCESEMVSARGLLYSSPGSDTLLESAAGDSPLVIQLFGSEPATLYAAVLLLRRHGYNAFDFNMGCPVRKVMRQGAGAALLADINRALGIAQAVLCAARLRGPDLPSEPALAGFKLRLPPDGKRGSAAALGRALEDMGAAWLTLHPRTASMGYGGRADWSEIALLAEAVAIPVIASGDMASAEAAASCLAQTGASCVMYARGAMRAPFVFARHRALFAGMKSPEPTRAGLAAAVERHVELTRRYCGDGRAFVKIRSIIPRYVRDLPGVGKLRAELSRCQSWEGITVILRNFLELA